MVLFFPLFFPLLAIVLAPMAFLSSLQSFTLQMASISIADRLYLFLACPRIVGRAEPSAPCKQQAIYRGAGRGGHFSVAGAVLAERQNEAIRRNASDISRGSLGAHAAPVPQPNVSTRPDFCLFSLFFALFSLLFPPVLAQAAFLSFAQALAL